LVVIPEGNLRLRLLLPLFFAVVVLAVACFLLSFRSAAEESAVALAVFIHPMPSFPKESAVIIQSHQTRTQFPTGRSGPSVSINTRQ
jgi:hypothetical protein